MNQLSIAISGSHGLVGSVLVPDLESKGHRIVRLSRDKATNRIEPAPIDGCDAVIHLAGENIAGGRWTEARKKVLRQSRVDNTRLLAEAMACQTGSVRQNKPPKIFLCASATGFYGNRDDEILDENSPPGEGFLSELTQAWEAACEPARKTGIRMVNLRFGIILSKTGGALAKMLPIFKLGLGGRLSSGKQWISWITLTDVVSVIHYLLIHDDISGPVNVVSPNPVTNLEFTKALGKALKRPAFLPAPALALRLVLGEMAEELLLASTRVMPKKLVDGGYRFTYADIDEVLQKIIHPE